MEPDQPVIAQLRALLRLSAGSGERLPEEWQVVARRMDIVHRLPVSHDIEPAGAPRLDVRNASISGASDPVPPGSTARSVPPHE